MINIIIINFPLLLILFNINLSIILIIKDILTSIDLYLS